MNKTAVFSIASKNYIAYARTLFESIERFHSDVDLHLLLVDEMEGEFDISKERFHITESYTIGISNFVQMSFKYNVLEFNTALKPYFMSHLIEKGYEKIIYLDPDIMVTRRMDLILNTLNSYSIVLTPHITSPILPEDSYLPSEQAHLLMGTYNLGFIAVSKTKETLNFIKWWSNKCMSECFHELETGLFVDQKWINLVPGLFENVKVLRHLGHNMAYWNLHERVIQDNKVNGQDDLVFYHFSGAQVENSKIISKYLNNNYTLDNRLDLIGLFESYRERVLANGFEQVKKYSYKYDKFANGEKIGTVARRLYVLVEDKYADPFAVRGDSYYSLLKKKKLLEKNVGVKPSLDQIKSKIILLNKLYKLAVTIIGIDRYNMLMRYLTRNSQIRQQDYLIK